MPWSLTGASIIGNEIICGCGSMPTITYANLHIIITGYVNYGEYVCYKVFGLRFSSSTSSYGTMPRCLVAGLMVPSNQSPQIAPDFDASATLLRGPAPQTLVHATATSISFVLWWRDPHHMESRSLCPQPSSVATGALKSTGPRGGQGRTRCSHSPSG